MPTSVIFIFTLIKNFDIDDITVPFRILIIRNIIKSFKWDFHYP